MENFEAGLWMAKGLRTVTGLVNYSPSGTCTTKVEIPSLPDCTGI